MIGKTEGRVITSHARRIVYSFLFGLAVIMVLAAIDSSRATDPAGAEKIAPWVMEHTANNEQAEFIVVLADQADLSAAAMMSTKTEKGYYVRDALWNKSQATQTPVRQWLNDRAVEHRSFYIVNALWVKGDRAIAEALAARPDVARVEGNPHIQNFSPTTDAIETSSQPSAPAGVEPGINYTHAPQAWAQGFFGQGIVVAGADTGFRWTHNAIKPHYRGWNGVTANHDYNWHDSIHDSTGNPCGNNSQFPCDDDGHGTHTMGTAIGDDGGGNQIGMAPQAQSIGCRNMDQGVGTPARYIECMEFFLAPYPVNGGPSQGDPSKAPDVTINSWGCPPSEGCSVNTLQSAVDSQRNAGIAMVVAAGNDGSGCSTISDPPSFYDSSYTVGALNTGSDTIASFSSRGPVTADGSNRIKPDIAAPGTNTRSSYNTSDTAYASLSGTSMATPHIAGALALLWSARPDLRHNVDATEAVLNNSAVHISSIACGSSGIPNNVFGFGRVDVFAAVQPTPTPTPTPTATPVPTATPTPTATPACDTNPPIISVPASIATKAQKKTVNGQKGTFVSFNVSATDPEDGPVTPNADPPSGSFFPMGTTAVTVTASDHCSNTASKTFTVTVKRRR